MSPGERRCTALVAYILGSTFVTFLVVMGGWIPDTSTTVEMDPGETRAIALPAGEWHAGAGFLLVGSRDTTFDDVIHNELRDAGLDFRAFGQESGDPDAAAAAAAAATAAAAAAAAFCDNDGTGCAAAGGATESSTDAPGTDSAAFPQHSPAVFFFRDEPGFSDGFHPMSKQYATRVPGAEYEFWAFHLNRNSEMSVRWHLGAADNKGVSLTAKVYLLKGKKAFEKWKKGNVGVWDDDYTTISRGGGAVDGDYSFVAPRDDDYFVAFEHPSTRASAPPLRGDVSFDINHRQHAVQQALGSCTLRLFPAADAGTVCSIRLPEQEAAASASGRPRWVVVAAPAASAPTAAEKKGGEAAGAAETAFADAPSATTPETLFYVRVVAVRRFWKAVAGALHRFAVCVAVATVLGVVLWVLVFDTKPLRLLLALVRRCGAGSSPAPGAIPAVRVSAAPAAPGPAVDCAPAATGLPPYTASGRGGGGGGGGAAAVDDLPPHYDEVFGPPPPATFAGVPPYGTAGGDVSPLLNPPPYASPGL